MTTIIPTAALFASSPAQHVEDIETVTPQHINAFLTWLDTDQGLAPKTILNHWIALSALWTWAEKEIELPHIIRGRVAPPRVRRQQPEPYTQENVKRMIEACDQTDHWRTKPGVRTRRSTAKRDKAILFTLLDTGLRASELCDLRIEDYDKSIGKLIVRKGKGGKGRSVFLGYTARSALWRVPGRSAAPAQAGHRRQQARQDRRAIHHRQRPSPDP